MGDHHEGEISKRQADIQRMAEVMTALQDSKHRGKNALLGLAESTLLGSKKFQVQSKIFTRWRLQTVIDINARNVVDHEQRFEHLIKGINEKRSNMVLSMNGKQLEGKCFREWKKLVADLKHEREEEE